MSRTPVADLRRPPRRRVDGVLLLDKPVGITSNAALGQVKRLYNADKAGHTGTLDPLASGLLPICFGEATKFAQFLLDASKRYIATIRFGVTTSTQDAEGDVVATRPVAFRTVDLAAALARFVGAQSQVPPAHAALKYKGRPYYEYARAGVEIPRAAREIVVHSLNLIEWVASDAIVDVLCSKGTYVRTLAADLGEALGCGAHLAGLRRVSVGEFTIANAFAPAQVQDEPPDRRARLLLPVDTLLAALPRIDIDGLHATHLLQGRAVPASGEHDELLRAYDPAGTLLGVVRRESSALVPVRMASSGQ
ncbi:MAG: tRNA pseudouridine(55) synthase TruB [Betaproteobacteria bacterium]|nr:tRNA pseudouridine(55) synthase TruB [Betaproteobacteria bacterium]MDE2003707.1 tRNA pseudouridine(55) synthase TruB [Betaproteobacteria bacterium]MDE2359118.1 tRNA pseudouridine(55) synthase TruB [Betaproteobacteria bacterium]